MEIIAKSKSVRMSPRKVRLVADSVRHLSVERALSVLTTLEKRASMPIRKTLESAVANAVTNAKIIRESLVIKRLEVMEGPSMKRFRPSTRGRTHPYKKRTSHITIVLEGGQK